MQSLQQSRHLFLGGGGVTTREAGKYSAAMQANVYVLLFLHIFMLLTIVVGALVLPFFPLEEMVRDIFP